MDTFELDAADLVDQFYAGTSAGLDVVGGMAFAYNLVQQTDKTIAKNNRLALMIEIHGKRQGKLAAQPVHQEMEVLPMAVKKVGNCEVCDRTKTTVVSVYNKKMCLPCSNAYSAVNVRPDIVMAAIKEFGLADKFLGFLGADKVPVHVESSALKAIAEMVGYEGENGDELLEKIRTMCMVAADGASVSYELERIYSALGIDQGDEAQIDVVIDAIATLTNTLERYQQNNERIKEEYTMTVDRLHELEQQHSAHLQVFAQLADLVQGNPEYPAELPSRFAELLSKAATDATVGTGPSREHVPQPSTLDSHLLDLVLDFPGIPLERIAVIREAV